MAEPITPLKTAGSLPSGRWITLPVPLPALPHCKVYIFPPLCPRLSSFHSSFFTLPSTPPHLHTSTPPRPTHSFITPPHYFLVSRSTELFTFCYCPQSSVFRSSSYSILSITLQRS